MRVSIAYRVGVVGVALAAALICPTPGFAGTEDDGAYVEGSLAWISSDRLDLVGSVAAEVPLATCGPWRVFTSVGAVTAIARTTGNFTFLVDRLSYTATLGGRRAVGETGAIEAFVGEQGLYVVDDVGRARVRVAGAAWESRGFRRAFGSSGWSGRASVAAVVEHRNVDAFAVATGAVRFLHGIGPNRRSALGVDGEIDALFGRDGGADVTLGPRVEFDLGDDRRFGISLRWLHAAHPLGIDTDGVLFGFDLAQGPHAGAARIVPPEVAGLTAAGAGSRGRAVARLAVRVASPPFLRGTYAEIQVDGNVLTAADRNDLFYLYDVGVAHPLASWRVGLWFHHRSNHVLDDINPGVTSLNVLEAGLETAGWNRAEPGVALGRAGALDASFRAGWLIDSAFGEDAGWHARGGARWASPEFGRTRVFVSVELERGDIGGSTFGAGALLSRGWEVRVEARHDEQLFSADRRARLAIATLRY